MTRIIYKISEKRTFIGNVKSDINFYDGYADFDTEEEHVHIPIINIIKIKLPIDKK